MPRIGAPVRRRSDGVYELRLSRREREAVVVVVDQLRLLLTSEHPASDEAVARLFPPARPDDVIDNLEYERAHADGLLLERLEALDTMERTLDLDRVTEDDLLAWLRSLTAIRLVVGTRLDITEETTEADFRDEASSETFALYAYLTWLQGWIVEALDEGLRAGDGAPGGA